MVTHWRFPFVYNGRLRYYFPFRDVNGNRVFRFPYQMQTEDGNGGGVLPEGAIALYDFKNGVYNNGSVLTLSDVLGDSTIFAGVFDPARVVSGMGLTSGAPMITLVGEALASAQAPLTFFMQSVLDVDTSLNLEFCNSDFSTDIISIMTTIAAAGTTISDQNGTGNLRGTNPAPGQCKSAYTVQAANMIAAINGTLLDDQDVPPAYVSEPPVLAPFDEVALTVAGSVLERIVIYPPKTGAELQALTI